MDDDDAAAAVVPKILPGVVVLIPKMLLLPLLLVGAVVVVPKREPVGAAGEEPTLPKILPLLSEDTVLSGMEKIDPVEGVATLLPNMEDDDDALPVEG